MEQNIEYVDLEEILSIFNEKEKEKILRTTGALQLTVGCTGQCSPACYVTPDSKISKAFSFDSLEKVFNKYARTLVKTDFVPYFRSDPLDYRDGDKNIIDFLLLVHEYAGYAPYVSTSIPEDAFEVALKLLDRNMLHRISKPYFSQNGKKIFPTADRISRWIDYVLDKRKINPSLRPAARQKLEKELNIMKFQHVRGEIGGARRIVIITPRGPKTETGTTGIYYYPAGCPGLTYLKNEITPENIHKQIDMNFPLLLGLRT